MGVFLSATFRRVRLVALAAAAVLLSLYAVRPYAAETASRFRATSDRSFADVEHWRSVFDDPHRDEWQKPREVVAALDLRPGMVVVDLGAGTGYFLGHFSRAVGDEGSVIAVETEPNLVRYIRERAEREGLANVVPVLASFDNPRLPKSIADRIVLVDTYHHIDRRDAYFRALARTLRPDGRVAVIDWRKKPLPVGPPLDHKLAREQVISEMREAGYVVAAERDILAYQYFVIFARADANALTR